MEVCWPLLYSGIDILNLDSRPVVSAVNDNILH